jgi:hypothetical protein
MLRRRGQDESGAVLAIVAVTMVAFMAIAALAIDVSSFYQAKRHAQSAADAGALAGAQDLASSPGSASADADSYEQQSFKGSTDIVTVDTIANTVTVDVTAVTPSFFGHALGLTSETVHARAVAGSKFTAATCGTPGNGCYAVFAKDSSCSTNGITMGGGTHIAGGVHSNGSLNVGGGGSSFGPTTYGTGCTVSPSGYASQNNTFTSGPTAQASSATWPLDYAIDFPPCTAGVNCTGDCDINATPCPSANQTPSFCTQATNAATWTLVSFNPGTLTSGNIYCDVGSGTAANPTTWTGAITASMGNQPVVESSFVAGSVTLSGGDKLTACGYSATGYKASGCDPAVPKPATANYPLVYAVGTGTPINNAGGGGTFTGDMFAPNGTIYIGGGVSTFFLEGLDVYIPGGGFTGDGPAESGTGSGGSTGSVSLTQ